MKRKKSILLVLLTFSGILLAEKDSNVSAYLTAQKLILNQIDSITPEMSDRLDSVFWAKWENHKNPKVAFHEAMCGVLSEAKYFYQYYKDDIDQRTWVMTNDDLSYYKSKQNLPDSALIMIKPIIEQRNKRIAFCEIRYFNNSITRTEAIKKIRDRYRNKISDITLKSNSKGASYNLGLVLENKTILKLSKEQVDSIVSAAQQVLALQDSGVISKAKNNRWEYERSFILKFLNETQIGDFLTIKNYDFAKDFALKRWKEIEDNKIAFEYDSAQVINEITLYQLNREKIRYIYKDEPLKLKELDDYLYNTSYPKSLKHLRIAKRQNTDQDTKDKDDLVL